MSDEGQRRRPYTASRRIFFVRVGRQPFGAWLWRRRKTSGVVCRLGPVGHVQVQEYRARLIGKHADGRRGAHGLRVSWWGTKGRRRKSSVEIVVHL